MAALHGKFLSVIGAVLFVGSMAVELGSSRLRKTGK
jgi:hypothetical protein